MTKWKACLLVAILSRAMPANRPNRVVKATGLAPRLPVTATVRVVRRNGMGTVRAARRRVMATNEDNGFRQWHFITTA